MRIEFEDKDLAVVRTERANELKLPVSVIKSFRRKLELIDAAPDERTLRNWKSLHYEKLKGSQNRSIRLNDQWRLIFRIDSECSPPKVTILRVEDYH